MEKGKKWDLVSIASIPLIMTLGNSMLIPVLPAIRSRLGVTSLQVSLMITVYSAIAIVLIPIAGYLSDKFGRKVVIVPSLIIAGIGGLVSGIAAMCLQHPYTMILLGRLLQGVGAAGAAPIVMPLVGDLFRKESDVSSGLGMIETSNTLGKVLSPILGSALAAWLWYLPFLAIPVFCLISVLLVWFLVKAPKAAENAQAKDQKSVDKHTAQQTDDAKSKNFGAFWASIKYIFRQKGRWLIAIFAIGCICMFVVFGTLFYLSDLLEEQFHIDGVLKGCVLAIPLAALCLASFLTGKWIGQNKKRMKWVTFIGIAVLAVCVLLCGMVQHIYTLLILISLAGIGIGSALPSLDAMITEGIEKEERGTISSLYSSMRFIGVAAGPPAASLLIKISPSVMFYSISAICMLAALLALFAIRPKQDKGVRKKA